MPKSQVTSMFSTLLFLFFALRPCFAELNLFGPDDGGFNPFDGLPDPNNFRPMGNAQTGQLGSANTPGRNGYGQGEIATEGYIRRGPVSVTTIPGATATGNFAQQDRVYSDAASGDIEEMTAVAAFGSSPTGYARDTEYICPADNGVTYSTSVEFPITYDSLH